MNEVNISPRAQTLLKHLVDLYLRDGQPVGSKTLVNSAFSSLSPATVRKVLGDLEEQGFLTSLHSSSGRVPTTQGIRFFVDSLLGVYQLEPKHAESVEAQLKNHHKASDCLITQTSNILSELTHMVGIVTLPQRESQILRHVEFLPLLDNRVLAILVFNEKEVQNRIIITDKRYSAAELTQTSNFLNHHFAGKDLLQARNELLQALKNDRFQVDSVMKTVVDVAGKALAPEQKQADYILAGQQNLFSDPTVTLSQLQKLFEAFTEKQQILHFLDQCLQSERVQLFIGDESGYDAFREYSVITSRYLIDGETVGVLGVIGPTRMRYDKVIPVVDLTAKLLGTLLNPKD